MALDDKFPVRQNIPYKLLKHHCRISGRSNFFAERVINAWNGLPADQIGFPKF